VAAEFDDVCDQLIGIGGDGLQAVQKLSNAAFRRAIAPARLVKDCGAYLEGHFNARPCYNRDTSPASIGL
jgi:hypothetical protein